jgi:hypothetical protein
MTYISPFSKQTYFQSTGYNYENTAVIFQLLKFFSVNDIADNE